ncbi:MAG TPA: tRNA (guanosine(37)-N1)-methyltransferase TrmD [Streptosporangiaceae bacterium]|nr:tRNA (guanosine(37)-N1)-methyltransferase TrmD [Streptosporangiaceae bacterium]
MRIDIITIFPGYFAPLGLSLIGKAAERGDIEFALHDLRAWAHDVHHTVDDTPYGGGPGMVMKAEPWGAALNDVLPPPGGPGRLVVPSPSGKPFTQDTAIAYATEPHLVFACGRYEGIDARAIEEAGTRVAVDELSIGDYVLAGGEPAVLVMIEAICRLLPGVLGNEESAADDSFGRGAGSGMAGLLEGPVYTRPPVWRGREVPPVLLSGDHAKIARWRRDAALRRTAVNRPDLVQRLVSGSATGPASVTESPGPQERSAPSATPPPLDARDWQVLSEAGFPVPGRDMAH